MNLYSKKPALILIDIQKGFSDEDYWGGNRNNKDLEIVCGKILCTWRKLQLPIFHIKHSSTNPDSKLHPSNKGFEFNEKVSPLPNELVIIKQVNSAFIGTDLKLQLDQSQLNTLILVGLTTNHCVSTTARMAGNYGYDTYVISDATACFDSTGINGERFKADIIHSIALTNLNKEFATIWNSKELENKL